MLHRGSLPSLRHLLLCPAALCAPTLLPLRLQHPWSPVCSFPEGSRVIHESTSLGLIQHGYKERSKGKVSPQRQDDKKSGFIISQIGSPENLLQLQLCSCSVPLRTLTPCRTGALPKSSCYALSPTKPSQGSRSCRCSMSSSGDQTGSRLGTSSRGRTHKQSLSSTEPEPPSPGTEQQLLIVPSATSSSSLSAQEL